MNCSNSTTWREQYDLAPTTPTEFANFSPGLGFQPWVFYREKYSTLKAFANSFGVDCVTVYRCPGLKQPWAEIGERLRRSPSEYPLDEHVLSFSQSRTLPHYGSQSYDEFEQLASLDEDEADRYFDFLSAYESQFYKPGACHHLFGYSSNVQGDMQLEAQLVTNGLYCGDATGYEDPRAEELRAGASDWILLLQLDSDRDADLMWGDAGYLYYWIRAEDLAAGRFDRVWMSLQCG